MILNNYNGIWSIIWSSDFLLFGPLDSVYGPSFFFCGEPLIFFQNLYSFQDKTVAFIIKIYIVFLIDLVLSRDKDPPPPNYGTKCEQMCTVLFKL